MYIANQGAPSCYYVNHSGSASKQEQGGFFWLRLIGAPDSPVQVGSRKLSSTKDAVGARVTVYTAGGQMVREVQGGMGFASQSEHALHFGVPDATAVERITIQWPSGRVQELAADAARALLNKHSRIIEIEELAQRGK